ncbi:MAG: protein kinase, partial [Lachnospiraceae bacterium]|nr:protein kinase [Lachnospiraceae bacterium]
MKTKKILTANLKPGMVSCEAAYTSSNHLVIQSNTTLTPDIIDKLKYYAIRAIKVYVPEPSEEESGMEQDSTAIGSDASLDVEGLTYFERVQQSEQFKEFKESVTKSVENFKGQLNDIVTKDNISQVCDDMLHEVDIILSKSRNSLHLLDMLQCLRGFDDMTYMHSMNVALICSVIGSWSGFPKEEMKVLLLCGLLHDIGKLKIAPDIIQKPGKLTDEEFRHSKKGSFYWMSPQVVSLKDYDTKTDIWSLGITCIELAETEPPFADLKPFEVANKLAKSPPTVEDVINVQEYSGYFVDFLDKCLQVDPNKRFSAKELIEHDFIKKFSKGKGYIAELV